jgi:hypothetical protein
MLNLPNFSNPFSEINSIFQNQIFFFSHFLLFLFCIVCVGKQNVNKNGGVGRVRGYRGRCLFAKKNFELETFFLMLKSEIKISEFW